MKTVRQPSQQAWPSFAPSALAPSGLAPSALALVGVLWLMGCGGPQTPMVSLSLKAQRICQEQQAELPPQTTPKEARLAYAACLDTVGQERASPPIEAAPSPTPDSPSDPAGASAAERYLFCRLHSEDVQAAAVAYNKAHWALLNLRSNPNTDEFRSAEADLARALEGLEAAIPIRMRGGLDLIPDAMRQFQSCDRSSFE